MLLHAHDLLPELVSFELPALIRERASERSCVPWSFICNLLVLPRPSLFPHLGTHLPFLYILKPPEEQDFLMGEPAVLRRGPDASERIQMH